MNIIFKKTALVLICLFGLSCLSNAQASVLLDTQSKALPSAQSGAQPATQTNTEVSKESKYKRSSLNMVLAGHPNQKYGKEIDSVFFTLPTPDKYENHDVLPRYIRCSPKENTVDESSIESFLTDSLIAQKMVAKWFNRNPETGVFDINLLAKRGNYNASVMDVKEALMNKRGLALLSDAGEELIGNTFVIINDITYVDKEKNAQIASIILSAISLAAATTSAVSSMSGGESASSMASTSAAVASVAALGAVISSTIAGFTVKVRSHLYKLDWNDSVAAVFYNDYWCDTTYTKEEIYKRKLLFESNTGLFKLEYVGKYKVKSAKTVLRGLNTNADVIKKVCARALDKSIAGLQKNYEVFKVKTPIYGVDNSFIQSQVGLKEGISPSSKFEVLQRKEDEEGRSSYTRIAIVKPVKGKIWDNRFMAVEEEAEGASLGATTFKKKGAATIQVGMLLRQLK